MAKISQFDLTDPLDGTETLPMVQAGRTKRSTVSRLVQGIIPFLQNWYKGDQGAPGVGFGPRTLVMFYGNSLVEAPAPLIPAARLLEDALNAGGGHYRVVNAGRSGETANQIRARVVDDVARGLIGHITIFGFDAVNSLRIGASVESIQADIQTCFDLVKGAGCPTVVSITDTPWRGYVDANPAYGWTAEKQLGTDAINAWKRSGPANVDIVVDAYASFEDPDHPETLLPIYDDGLHLHYPQPGQDKVRDLILADVPVTADGDLALDVIGRNARVDQDVSTGAGPRFEGVTVGAHQGGFGPNFPLFEAQYSNATGGRGIGIGTRWFFNRSITIDGVWSATWRSLDHSINDGAQAQIGMPFRFYGTGYGAFSISTANAEAQGLTERFLVLPNGNVGIGHGTVNDPVRKSTVSNDGAETYEVGPGNANPVDPSGAITHLSYNRATGEYLDSRLLAERHIFTNGTAANATFDRLQNSWYVNMAPDSDATRDLGRTDSRWRLGCFTSIDVAQAGTFGSIFVANASSTQRPGDFRSTAAGFGESVVFAAHANTILGNANLFAGYDLAAGAFRFRVLDNGNVQNANNSYGAVSDRKLKRDIEPAPSQWDDVKALAAAMSRYRLIAEVEQDADAHTHLGAIAQDWQAISPGLVFSTPDTRLVSRPVTRSIQCPVYEERVVDEKAAMVQVDVVERTIVEDVETFEETGEETLGIKYSIAMLKLFKAVGEVMERIERIEAAGA